MFIPGILQKGMPRQEHRSYAKIIRASASETRRLKVHRLQLAKCYMRAGIRIKFWDSETVVRRAVFSAQCFEQRWVEATEDQVVQDFHDAQEENTHELAQHKLQALAKADGDAALNAWVADRGDIPYEHVMLKPRPVRSVPSEQTDKASSKAHSEAPSKVSDKSPSDGRSSSGSTSKMEDDGNESDPESIWEASFHDFMEQRLQDWDPYVMER